MLLRDAINRLIAGIGLIMLMLGPGRVATSDPVFAGERQGDRIVTKPALLPAKLVVPARKEKPATSQPLLDHRADDLLRDEFADSSIRIDPAAALPDAYRQAEAAPLHGYGTFEGIV